MPEIVLDEPEVGHLAQVGDVIAARVAQHVRPHVTELGAGSSLADDVGDALTGELLSTPETTSQGRLLMRAGTVICGLPAWAP